MGTVSYYWERITGSTTFKATFVWDKLALLKISLDVMKAVEAIKLQIYVW